MYWAIIPSAVRTKLFPRKKAFKFAGSKKPRQKKVWFKNRPGLSAGNY